MDFREQGRWSDKISATPRSQPLTSPFQGILWAYAFSVITFAPRSTQPNWNSRFAEPDKQVLPWRSASSRPRSRPRDGTDDFEERCTYPPDRNRCIRFL